MVSSAAGAERPAGWRYSTRCTGRPRVAARGYASIAGTSVFQHTHADVTLEHLSQCLLNQPRVR